jgi:hypothetical protein
VHPNEGAIIERPTAIAKILVPWLQRRRVANQEGESV